MGNQASKSKKGAHAGAESMTFYNQNNLTMKFSPSFLTSIAPELSASSISSSTSSSSSPLSELSNPAEDIESIIQDKLDRKLERFKQERLNHEKRNVEAVLREVDDIWARSQEIRKPVINKEYLAKEQEVITCYDNNPRRVLDCWKEVEDLKLAVKQAQTAYVSASAH